MNTTTIHTDRNSVDRLQETDIRSAFLEGMSRTAATVNIVATDGPVGRAGVTISAMTSVSADTADPTLLVCLHQDGSATVPILSNGVFSVNVLRDNQKDIANEFAGRAAARGVDRFFTGDWANLGSGTPRLVNPLVAFNCRLDRAQLVGTHYVVLGAVERTFIGNTGRPLIYSARDYGTPAALNNAA